MCRRITITCVGEDVAGAKHNTRGCCFNKPSQHLTPTLRTLTMQAHSAVHVTSQASNMTVTAVRVASSNEDDRSAGHSRVFLSGNIATSHHNAWRIGMQPPNNDEHPSTRQPRAAHTTEHTLPCVQDAAVLLTHASLLMQDCARGCHAHIVRRGPK